MPRRILVTGATGNQGGSVARLLLAQGQSPSSPQPGYTVRALTRDTSSAAARTLAAQGAEVVQGDLRDPASLVEVFRGCWGAFVVTNFYDAKIKDDPSSEEEQGKNAARVASQTPGLECFVWSTLPSSLAISGGEVCCEIYEGKFRVDAFIRDELPRLPATFVYTGNFYENMILRGHVRWSDDNDVVDEGGERPGGGRVVVEFRQPIIAPETKLHMVWVEKDLAGVVKAILDHWDERKDELTHRHLYAMDAIHTPSEICSTIQRVTGIPTKYTVLPTTGNVERDKMFTLYNRTGTYPGVSLPDPTVLDLGVELHGLEQFVRERLVPYLGIDEKDREE